MVDAVLNCILQTRHRPVMYIGSYSANAMFLYLAGYSAALQDHTSIDLSQYTRFIESLYEKFGRGGHSWAWVLGRRVFA